MPTRTPNDFGQRPLAAVILLGCPKNQVDAEYLLGALVRAGYELTAEPAQADVIIITTCAFLQSAVRESEAVIVRALRLKRSRPEIKVVVFGCLVQRLGQEFSTRYPEVDYWVGLSDVARIPALLGRRPQRGPTCRILATPPHLAYLRIADGCSNHCSYCTIPLIRGPLRSRPVEDILAEARALARAGVKELVLVAQDTTAYGLDRSDRPQLAPLLRRLAGIDDIRWLRLMYTHPVHVTDDVIAEFGENPKLCRYIDIPLQHVATRVLARMNRRYRRKDIDALLARLRKIPEIAIRTTLIVGFPGETEAEFRELLDFLRGARLNRVATYAYSSEPGTRAARFGPAVAPVVKRRRVRELMRTQAAISQSRLRESHGQELTVLIDEPGRGRTEWDAPEVDGVVRIEGPSPCPGQFRRVLITGSTTHDLKGRLVPD